MDQQLCNQERDSSLDPAEPQLPQIKDTQVEFWTRRDVEHLLLKKVTGSSCKATAGVSEKSIVHLDEDLDGQDRLTQMNLITSGMKWMNKNTKNI